MLNVSLGILASFSYLQNPADSLFDITGPSHSCFTSKCAGVWVKLDAAICKFLKSTIRLICPLLVPYLELCISPGPQKGDK